VILVGSVGRLLIAGILQGLITMAAYSGLIMLRVYLKPSLAPKVHDKFPMSVRIKTLLHAWPLLLVVIVVIGGLYSGTVSATEVGAFGPFVVLLVSIVDRSFSWSMIWRATVETFEVTATIFLIAIGAVIFSKFITISQL